MAGSAIPPDRKRDCKFFLPASNDSGKNCTVVHDPEQKTGQYPPDTFGTSPTYPNYQKRESNQMILVNETRQKVAYWINAGGGSPECGHIDVDGIVDLPNAITKRMCMWVSNQPGPRSSS